MVYGDIYAYPVTFTNTAYAIAEAISVHGRNVISFWAKKKKR